MSLLTWLFGGKSSRQTSHQPSSGHDGAVPPEHAVAIAMILSLHGEEVHDQESGKITIRRMGSSSSNWSNKVQNIN